VVWPNMLLLREKKAIMSQSSRVERGNGLNPETNIRAVHPFRILICRGKSLAQ